MNKKKKKKMCEKGVFFAVESVTCFHVQGSDNVDFLESGFFFFALFSKSGKFRGSN